MAEGPRKLPQKKDVALELLQGPSLYVHLDPRKPGVVVPKWFMGQANLVLQVGLNMQIPIPDLDVDDDGVTCTLSFNRAAFFCRMPWSAVYALIGEEGQGMVWPDDVPPEVAAQMQQKNPKAPAPKKPKPKLAAIAAPPPEESRSIAKPERAEVSLKDVSASKVLAVKESEPPPSKDDGIIDEPVESASPGKKKRELPPYLRVIK